MCAITASVVYPCRMLGLRFASVCACARVACFCSVLKASSLCTVLAQAQRLELPPGFLFHSPPPRELGESVEVNYYGCLAAKMRALSIVVGCAVLAAC